MIEYEKKYHLRDKDALVAKLEELGFEQANQSSQKDVYYTRADVDYMKTKECLRIRTDDNGSELTYKPPTDKKMQESQAIWKEETNLDVDPIAAAQLLDGIGCSELCTVDKSRTSYKKDRVTVAVDHVVDAGDFVEIEILSETQEELLEQIDSTAEELGVADDDIVTLPYRDLVMGYAE